MWTRIKRLDQLLNIVLNFQFHFGSGVELLSGVQLTANFHVSEHEFNEPYC